MQQPDDEHQRIIVSASMALIETVRDTENAHGGLATKAVFTFMLTHPTHGAENWTITIERTEPGPEPEPQARH